MYEIRLGSLTIDPRNTDDLQSLHVHLSMDVPSDNFESVLRIRGNNPGFEKDDNVLVSIGYDDELTQVYKGTVDSIDLRFSTVRIMALSSMIKLCTFRIDKLRRQVAAGDIVKDLAEEAGVEIERVSDGLKLPYYALDSNKNAYEHIVDLGRSCGFDVYTTNEDKLVFKEYEPSEPQLFEYGRNIISISRTENKDLVNSVRIFGESLGSDKAHWLVKQPLYAEEGAASDGERLVLHYRAARDKDTASRIAKATLDRLKSSVSITLEALGSPKLMLGHTIKVEGAPEEALNGQYQVREIEHFLSKSSGFTTIVHCRDRGVVSS
jgi:phage protein D